MSKLYSIIILSLASLICINAQQKTVELEDFISKDSFRRKQVNIKPMKDGKFYSVLENNGSQIVKYAYDKEAKIEVIADIPNLKKTPIKSIIDYKFSDDESKILVYRNRENIHRHSFKADYFVIDVKRNEIEPLSHNGKQQEAEFSPDGYSVAFVRNNNIFIRNLRFGTEAAVTSDGKKNHIINGIPDWVYEEEFSFTKAFEWSPDNQELAFLKFDESEVDEYDFPLYKGSFPSLDDNELYPDSYIYKYPKAGRSNSLVSVHVYNLRHRTTKKMELDDQNIYIPRIKWTTQSNQLAIISLTRRQDQLDLYFVNSTSGVARVIFTDRNKRYIEESELDNIIFLENGEHFLYLGESDGYKHLHLYGTDGRHIRQITKGDWDVTRYLDFDASNNTLYFQAAAISPLQREVYSININGTKQTKLSVNTGINMAWFSSNKNYYVNSFSNTKTPPLYQVFNSKNGKLLKTIEDNSELKNKFNEYKLPMKEFFTFTTVDGSLLNGWMIKPPNFNPEKQYPLLMIQYSGPGSQSVLDQWENGWEFFLASKGYVVSCVDGRGTGGRGEDFKKQTYMQLGKLESEDQVAAAEHLAKLAYIDKNRIGIWGWSYGGYIAALSMSISDIFKVGIAVAPVTHWKFYDTIYTERFMRKPQENPSGYNNYSPLDMADKLSGHLLLIHGTADNNVHLQNTMEYSDKLIQAGKQFDMFIYPNREHDLMGGNVRMHLYNMKFNFLEKKLK